MDLIFICREALEDSLIANIAAAMEAKGAGLDVGVLFTGEALWALAEESFSWSPLFQGRSIRARISKNATAMGIEIANPKDGRWTDRNRLMESAAARGIHLMACPLWVSILGIAERIPKPLTPVDRAGLLRELQQAKVIGGF
jgi:peroxiredoxin family protein